MRAFGLALLLAAGTFGAAQSSPREGSYAPKGGKATTWRINENHALVWDGARYTPVGVRVDGTPEAVDAANAAGIKDLLIDLPESGDWSGTIAEAEKNGQRYLVRIASLALGAPGIAVDPAAYRVAGLTGSKHLDLPLPGASEALVVVALQRDGSMMGKTLLPVKDGRIEIDTKVNAGLDNVVLIYPRMEALPLPDLWDRLDGHRDTLLARLARAPFGPGLRGLVDPLGRTAVLPGGEAHGVPTSPAFQAELASVLESHYRTVRAAMDGWSLSASTLTTYASSRDGKGSLNTTYADLARMVPLWSGGRGVSMLWDPSTGQTYKCERDRSQIWKDIDNAIALASARRVGRLCAAIRRVVDVPVVQEWAGWSGLTEARDPAFDGVAARPTGSSPAEFVDSAARAVSTVVRWSTRGWLLATDVTAPKRDLQASVDDLASLGLDAAFVSAPPDDVAAVAKSRTANPPLDASIDPVFFPENGMNPAAVQHLPGGRWWLPTPEDGNRLDLGESFFGYRMATPKGSRVVMWARTPGRYLLRMAHPEGVTFTTLDGTDPDPKKAKGGVTVTLGQFPLTIEGLQEVPNLDLPVPDLAVRETLATFDRMILLAETGNHVGVDESYAFKTAVERFDANPGGSYEAMRQQIRRFAGLLSPLAWVEAESSRDTTFSDVAPVPGASNGRALVLRAALPTDDGYVANYTVPTTTRNDVDLWVAARIAPEQRRDLEATIGGVTLVATEPPVSAYGAGFAWYRLGTTRMEAGVTKVSLRLRTGVGGEAAIDALVFSPLGWRPNGVTYPYEFVAGAGPAKPPTR